MDDAGTLALATPWPEVDHGLPPGPRWRSTQAPLPTNAFWMNLALGGGDQPVVVGPYVARAYPERLSVAVPARVVSETTVLTPHVDQLSLGVVEPLAGFVIEGYDPLSVTLQWDAPGGGRMVSPLVQGMVHATVRLEGLTPRIGTALGITGFGVDPTALGMGPVTTDRLWVQLGDGQRWRLYTTEPVTWEWAPPGLRAQAPITGDLRAAPVPAGAPPAAVDLLDAAAAAVPTGGEVGLYSCTELAQVVLSWTFDGDGTPLLVTLPHHRPRLAGRPSPTDDPAPIPRDLSYDTLRGPAIVYEGATWAMDVPDADPASAIGWFTPRGIDPARASAVREALVADQALVPVADDTYFFGKQIAAMGRLALIADELGEPAIAARVRANMATALEPYLAADGGRLAYDRTWGGVLAAGLQDDPGAGFGQGYYNDHHFHYGYFIYAAAVIARGDSAWADAHRDAVDALVRDIANPSRQDPYFTPWRTKDWYAGHSWAAGLFEFGDGRNQESTSEAVNAWYAVKLWGDATGRWNLREIGTLGLATEIDASHAYWQIADTSVYPSPFADKGTVGILWSTKADYATFFGANVEYIHGIQLLPFTPMSEALLRPEWLEVAYPVMATAYTRADPPLADEWRGYLQMAHAVLDPAAAWPEIEALTRFDDGNTATNARYWAATRP